MRLRSVDIRGFRSIADSGEVLLGKITVLIGPNNSGKSAFLHALYQMQEGAPVPSNFIRKGQQSWAVKIRAEQLTSNPFGINDTRDFIRIGVAPRADTPQTIDLTIDDSHHMGRIGAREPTAYIHPSFSKRKVNAFQQRVDRASATTVGADWSFLVSRLARLTNPDFPGAEAYRKACRDILGFVVTTFPSEGGLQAGQYFDADTTVELEAMGEGVASITGLLIELATGRNKLFLVEEPENDLHPAALKAVLDLMLVSAEDNQFIVSTHSNIVLRYLAAHPDAKVVRVSTEPDELPPVSRFTAVEDTPEARLAVLRELGYELADFDLYEGWLILEESSAERLIRQYFLKWFTPRLVGRLRTVAAAGTSDIEPAFRDLHRLCVYGHLETAYRGRIWVVVDNESSGASAIAKLVGSHTTWPEDRFRIWSQANFEHYYPANFTVARDAALALRGQAKRTAKKQLLDDVVAWIDADEAAAREAFAVSAADVIQVLGEVEASW